MNYNNLQYFVVEQENVSSDSFSLTGEEYHHAAHVLRMSVGTIIAAVDGQGNEYLGTIHAIVRDREINCNIIKTRRKPNEPINSIVLIQALIKGDRFDYIIEKCVELGASQIIPVVTKRCVVTGSSNKIKRWQTIARSAMKQSGRSLLPAISEIMEVNDAFEHAAQETRMKHAERLLLHKNGKRTLADYCQDESDYSGAKTYVLAVGPEGDFTTDELLKAQNTSFQSVSLGPRRLRSDTAGIAALSFLMLNEQ